MPTAAVATNSPPSRRKKSDSYYKVTNHMLNLSFRFSSTIDDNYTNISSHISKDINGNFNLEYKLCTTLQRRSNRNRTSHEINKQTLTSANDNEAAATKTELVETNFSDFYNDLIVCSFLRCYVEDFMTRNIGEILLVLIPANYFIMATSKWTQIFDSDIRSTPVQFTKVKYSDYMGVVSTNPFINNVLSGMYLSDYESGFITHNYGCSIMFPLTTSSESIIITWQEVLDGKKNGIQVWRIGDVYRYVYSNFTHCSKTAQSLTALMSTLYAEVYGYWRQRLNLVNFFNRANMKNQGKLIRDYEGIIQKYIHVVLCGELFEALLDRYNDLFGLAIKKCYSDFVVICQPIITCVEIDGLVELYKSKMSNHYHTMYSTMIF